MITLHGLNAQYIRFFKLEESMLKQKIQLQWFKEGDVKFKYFHALISGRRRKLFIHKIQDEEGTWIQGDEAIANTACQHFQHIFTGQEIAINEEVLNYIPTLVTEKKNIKMQEMPTLEELRVVVFSMNPNSAPSPDGMNGKFFSNLLEYYKD